MDMRWLSIVHSATQLEIPGIVLKTFCEASPTTVRGAIRDAICAATPDTTVAVGSIWEGYRHRPD